jgi:hypothetical protein
LACKPNGFHPKGFLIELSLVQLIILTI